MLIKWTLFYNVILKTAFTGFFRLKRFNELFLLLKLSVCFKNSKKVFHYLKEVCFIVVALKMKKNLTF
jgi:hypothetical protein